MEADEKRFVKRILVATGVLIGIFLLLTFIDRSGLLNRELLKIKTKPCETGTCTKCYGLDWRGVCLGVMQVTTTVEQ